MSLKDSLSRSNHRRQNTTSATDTVIRRKNVQKSVPFLKEDVVPAGKYVSEIIAVYDAVTDKSKDAVDIHYTFTDCEGNVVVAKERYVIDGYYFELLGEALLDAGLPNGAKISQAVSITEDVVVTYPRPGAIGRIQSRVPHRKKMVSTSVTDDQCNANIDSEDDDSDFMDDFEEEFD